MKIHPWQIDMLDKMTKYKGRGMVQVTGRQIGKSMASDLNAIFRDVYYPTLTDIVLSEGTVYGARYYTAQPIGGDWHEMVAWSLEHFGSSGSNIWGEDKAPEPAERWYMNNRKFWFRDEMDRMIFVLKWR